MNKENKKIAQERRAQEREKQQKKNRRKEILANWGPIVIIGVVVVALVVAIVTSGGSDADEVEEGSEIGFTYIDENGNAILIDEKRNHKDWVKAIEKLAKNPELVTLLQNNLYNSIKDTYNLTKVTNDRANWYREINNRK